MTRLFIVAAVCLGALTVASCIVSFEDYPVTPADGSASGGSGGSGASGGTGGSCETCVTVPDGFQGPIAAAVGDPNALPACPAPYTTELPMVADQLLVVPQACDPPECDPHCYVTIEYFGETNCATPLGSPHTFAFGVCTPGNFPAAISLRAKSAPSCGLVSNSKPSALTWGEHARLCALAQQTECDGGSACMPVADPPFDRCVFAEGEVDCPAEFPKQRVFYQSVEDNRSCTAGTCAPAVDSCPGSLTTFDVTCSTQMVGCSPLDNTEIWCCDPDGQAAGLFAQSDDNAGSCMASPGEYVPGSTIAASPLTLCCE